jgi:hypothetical protein
LPLPLKIVLATGRGQTWLKIKSKGRADGIRKARSGGGWAAERLEQEGACAGDEKGGRRDQRSKEQWGWAAGGLEQEGAGKEGAAMPPRPQLKMPAAARCARGDAAAAAHRVGSKPAIMASRSSLPLTSTAPLPSSRRNCRRQPRGGGGQGGDAATWRS